MKIVKHCVKGLKKAQLRHEYCRPIFYIRHNYKLSMLSFNGTQRRARLDTDAIHGECRPEDLCRCLLFQLLDPPRSLLLEVNYLFDVSRYNRPSSSLREHRGYLYDHR